ncbi:CcoQ/FixQ family Cbb3-type cytochrome c oxidase assembly chaperone [Cesiribacter sp. SM1]|uniref:CcoQ/FixQ family Cbb3-type cytochrome c oxidase assembly chaperone n=1 Tax=Cesiribacter sp. SM1 TaxID=2861196 RepID=UPI001CD3F789|nr:CcoQ/FixQ family Cbb3-type cytochrome c oxidase assembly chaperone [Cesiribacter sp. SM1]
METIIGIELYPIISLLIFFIFFTLLLIVVVKTKKEHITELSAMPLDEEELTIPAQQKS